MQNMRRWNFAYRLINEDLPKLVNEEWVLLLAKFYYY